MKKIINISLFLVLISFFISCGDNKSTENNALGQDSDKEEKVKLLAPTPPMGWNSWNYFGKHQVNEDLIIKIIDAIANNGWKDAGYEYVVIDGGWRDTKLGTNGELLPHPKKFPNGMKRLADYAHTKGLKFGLHTVPGSHDCINDPVGGYGREEIHIQQLVDWGIDFIKLDKCNLKDGWTEQIVKDTYYKWHKMLKEKSNNSIVLSISAYNWRDWYPEVCQMARTTGDISARVAGMSGSDAVFEGTIPESESSWKLLTITEVAEENNKWAQYAGNGYWNDPDMLVTGNHGMSLAEQKSQFALWCIMSSPLMLGNNPLDATQEEESIILNKTAIAVNQDATEQGKRIFQKNNVEIWAKNLKNEKIAMLLLNRNQEKQQNITLNLSDMGITDEVNLIDVYNEKDIGTVTDSIAFEIDPKSSLFLLLKKN